MPVNGSELATTPFAKPGKEEGYERKDLAAESLRLQRDVDALEGDSGFTPPEGSLPHVPL